MCIRPLSSSFLSLPLSSADSLTFIVLLVWRRAFIYEAVEDFLFKFGMDGKACLLRAICETHESPLIGYGLFGEVIDLFLS